MIKKISILIISAIILSACSSTSKTNTSKKNKKTPTRVSKTSNKKGNVNQDADYIGLILKSEENSSGKARDVLRETRKMALFERATVKGGCWDYLDAAWTRAGVPRQQRQIVFKSQKSGPYAASNQLKAGDWLYHINYSYNNIEHSGMFIGWVDESKKLGVTLSYAGSARKEPARYRVYDLSGVYYIMRAQ